MVQLFFLCVTSPGNWVHPVCKPHPLHTRCPRATRGSRFHLRVSCPAGCRGSRELLALRQSANLLGSSPSQLQRPDKSRLTLISPDIADIFLRAEVTRSPGHMPTCHQCGHAHTHSPLLLERGGACTGHTHKLAAAAGRLKVLRKAGHMPPCH